MTGCRGLLVRRLVAVVALTTATGSLLRGPALRRSAAPGLRRQADDQRVLPTPAPPSPAPPTPALPIPAPPSAGGTQVVLLVGPTDYVRLGPTGRVREVRTTTGRLPCATDRVLVVRPDGSTVEATAAQVAEVLRTSWAGAFVPDAWVPAGS